MSFVQRELDRIAVKLRELEIYSQQWKELHIAQQALAWATDPACFRSPYSSITGIPDDPRTSPTMPVCDPLTGEAINIPHEQKEERP